MTTDLPAAHQTADPGSTRQPPVEVTRAEEQVRVHTVTRVKERVRIQKRVEHQEVTRTVTLAREVLEVDHIPVGADDDSDRTDEAASPTEIEIVLHEERVTVTTEVVPVERVRIRVVQVTDQVEIAEVVHREQVEVTPVTSGDVASERFPAG